MTNCNALTFHGSAQGLVKGLPKYLTRALFLVVGALVVSMAAWGQSEPLALRRIELRSAVRQQQANNVAPVNNANQTNNTVDKPVNERHLSPDERLQLRHQLTRDLREQHSTVSSAR
jgi:hypothetical protein